MKNAISENYFNSERNNDEQEINALIDNAQNIESGFYPETNNGNGSIKCKYIP